MISNPVQEALAAQARAADVVVFRSGLTDVRSLRAWLERHEVPYREVEMSMGSGDQRARFHALRDMTGWKTLPQVFVRGEFVRGEHELKAVASPLSQRDPGSIMSQTISPMIQWLGYAGLIPFVAAALATIVLSDPGLLARIEQLLLGYGAVILSFLGAIHWGRVLQPRLPDQGHGLAVYGVLPSILAWMTLALSFGTAAPLQAALFLLVYLVDRAAYSGSEIPMDFLRLRLQLTSVAVVSILIAWGRAWTPIGG